MFSSPFSQSDVVLITGGNGHVAQHTVDQILSINGGPNVIATVRSQTAKDTVIGHYANHVAADRLRVVIIADIKEDSAFHDAVKGVTHVAHIASPLVVNPQAVEDDLLKPAIAGTLSILRAAARESSVKKVVITSSFAACVQMDKGWWPDHEYDESSWNSIKYEEAAAPGATFPDVPLHWRDFVTYCASKALAERAAWDFVTTNKPSYTLTTVLPTYIFGPSILPLARGADSFSFSNSLVWLTATKDDLLPMDWPQFVDVRDVARVHVAALQSEEANGERFLASAGDFFYQDISEIAAKKFPSLKRASSKRTDPKHYSVSHAKAERILGVKDWISLEQSVTDTLAQVV